VIREALAPFVERLEKVNQELGQVRAEREAFRLRVLELETTLSMSSTSPNAPQDVKEPHKEQRGLEGSVSPENGTQPLNLSIIERVRRLFTGQ
jgi:hypothetical protein